MRAPAILVIGLITCATGLTQDRIERQETRPSQSGAPIAGPQGAPPGTSTAMPDEIAALGLPGIFEWTGGTSRSRNEGVAIAGRFTSTLGPDEALALAQAALVEGGWELDEAGSFTSVFVSPDRPYALQFCRNDRQLNLGTTGLVQAAGILLTVQPAASGMACGSGSALTDDVELLREVPRLTMPADPASGTASTIRGFGGFRNDGDVFSHAVFQLETSLAVVAARFEGELAAQGWERDAGWTGTSSAGSSWSKHAGQQRLYGGLSLHHLGNRNIAAAFRVLRLQPSATAGRNSDQQILNSLVFLGRHGETFPISREVPAATSGFRIPAQFELVGTATAGRDEMTTAYRTSLPLLRARESMLEAMAAAGWRSVPSLEEEPVFLITNRPRVNLVCRNSLRRRIRVQEIDDVRYVSITALDRTAIQRECPIPYPQQLPSVSNTQRTLAPTLEFPDSVVAAPGSLDLNVIHNGTHVMLRTRIQSAQGPQSIVEALAPQMTRQGWERDALWSAPRSAGSTWRRSSDAGVPVWGELRIIDLGDAEQDVQLNLILDRKANTLR